MTNEIISTVSAIVFVIPNTAPKIGDFIFGKGTKLELLELVNTICELNGLNFDVEKDHLVHVWIVSDEKCCGEKNLHTENWYGHGGHIKIDGKRYLCNAKGGCYLPSPLFVGHKEGDIINVKLPVNLYGEDDVDPQDAVIEVELKLDQTHYRYRRFGAFEVVLKDLGVTC